MEELADAIEDAQYVNAISTQDDGPKPVLPWEKPTEEQLEEWERLVRQRQEKINAKITQRMQEKVRVADQKELGADKSTLSAALKVDTAGSGGTGVICDAFTMEWVCQQPIGYFLFSQFVKEYSKEYIRMNFCEEALRFRKIRSRRSRLVKAVTIAKAYLMRPTPITEENSKGFDETSSKDDGTSVSVKSILNSNNRPRATEIVEYDLYRCESSCSQQSPKEIRIMASLNMDYPICTESLVGLKGPVRREILDKIYEVERLFPDETQDIEAQLAREIEESATTDSAKGSDFSTALYKSNEGKKKRFRHSLQEYDSDNEDTESKLNLTFTGQDESAPPLTTFGRSKSAHIFSTKKPGLTNSGTDTMLNSLSKKMKSKREYNSILVLIPDDMFDKAETIVMESLRDDFWDAFQQSSHYSRLKNFLWYQDRRVIPDDFLTMRVLGRGGFGLVYACKKGTSGKLYAMKVMNKRRIKMKKSEMLCINERKALEAVNSKFVVKLNYSFHSKEDVYLILDLMTGGDLGFHLHQRGRFSKAECLYYSARVMLGLQALHNERYVYRDLKPENCLLGEDGRVKITDLGLCTRITPDLTGAAGTRGYWAPEMLRRDGEGKRIAYGHTVDWFSFGCCVAEFISGTNPFRSEAALNFGLERGKQTKEKAIDCATLEMIPEFKPERYEPDAADLCRRLLDKNEKTRLGAKGCQEIMSHPWFKSVNWDRIISDRESPPFTPLRDINAASREEISTFPEDKACQEIVLTENDEKLYRDWDWTNPGAFAAEVIEVLIYERETGEILLPMAQNGSCCCAIL